MKPSTHLPPLQVVSLTTSFSSKTFLSLSHLSEELFLLIEVSNNSNCIFVLKNHSDSTNHQSTHTTGSRVLSYDIPFDHGSLLQNGTQSDHRNVFLFVPPGYTLSDTRTSSYLQELVTVIKKRSNKFFIFFF